MWFFGVVFASISSLVHWKLLLKLYLCEAVFRKGGIYRRNYGRSHFHLQNGGLIRTAQVKVAGKLRAPDTRVRTHISSPASPPSIRTICRCFRMDLYWRWGLFPVMVVVDADFVIKEDGRGLQFSLEDVLDLRKPKKQECRYFLGVWQGAWLPENGSNSLRNRVQSGEAGNLKVIKYSVNQWNTSIKNLSILSDFFN